MDEQEEPVKRKRGRPPGRAKNPPKWTKEAAQELADAMESYFTRHPSALFLGEFKHQKFNHVYRELIADLSDKYPFFADAIKRIKAILEVRLAKGATTGKLKETFTIFNLKCNYGWVDKQVVEQHTTVTLKGSLAKALLDLDKQARDAN